MRRDTKKKERISDIVGVCSGILLLAILVFNIVWANTVHTIGVRDSAVPDSAMTVQGTADGRNGPITVEVVADQDQIYQLRVLSQEETDGIGSEALTKLPKAIINGQDLDVDAVGGATITSEALRNAIVSALREAGIDTKAFNLRTVKLENVATTIAEVEAGNSAARTGRSSTRTSTSPGSPTRTTLSSTAISKSSPTSSRSMTATALPSSMRAPAATCTSTTT